MLILHMPASYKIGDTAEVKINGESRKLYWPDADHLVIDDGDVRRIAGCFPSRTEDGLTAFVCA